jgi:hypothetical protein
MPPYADDRTDDRRRDPRGIDAARVHRDAAQPALLVGGGQPGDRDGDLRAVGAGVVERHLHNAAPGAGRRDSNDPAEHERIGRASAYPGIGSSSWSRRPPAPR